jgi:hypothetical protein
MQPARAPIRVTAQQVPPVQHPPAAPLVPYQLSCDEAHLGPGLGPPDYYPPQPVSDLPSSCLKQQSLNASAWLPRMW